MFSHRWLCPLVFDIAFLLWPILVRLSALLQNNLLENTRSVQKVTSHVMWKREIFMEVDTRYKKHCTQDNEACLLQNRHLGTSLISSPSYQLPHCIFLNLINILKSLPFQMWFQFWEEPEVAGCQLWAVKGLSHLGDWMFRQKALHKTWCMSRCIIVIKLPVTSCP